MYSVCNVMNTHQEEKGTYGIKNNCNGIVGQNGKYTCERDRCIIYILNISAKHLRTLGRL